jgi:predicted RNase H-like nuclease (RuvC/YqgF family)
MYTGRQSQHLPDRYTMTQAREPDDSDVARSLRRLDRRVSRLEDTQVTWRELNDSFNRVYDEIDALEDQMNRRFDEQSQKLDEQNRKIDIILRHITGADST